MTQMLPFADARVLALLDRYERAIYADQAFTLCSVALENFM